MQLVRLVLALWLIVAGFAGTVDLCGPELGDLAASGVSSLEAAPSDDGCEDESCTDCFDGCIDCACCALRQPVVAPGFALTLAEPLLARTAVEPRGTELSGSNRDVFLPPRA